MNIKSLILIKLCLVLGANCCASISSNQVNRIADCIWTIEGGNQTRFAYGIKSIPIKGSNPLEREAYARKICLNTIKNNYIRWEKSGQTNDFFEFLANKYAPTTINITSLEKKCNKYWLPNFRRVLGVNTYAEFCKQKQKM